MSDIKQKEELEGAMSDWDRHQLLVLSSLDRLEQKLEAIYIRQHLHDKEIDRLKLRSGLLGLIAGALSGIGIKFFPH